METLWRYLKIQAFVLVCGIVGPVFLVMYFVIGADPVTKWMFWAGLSITVLDVLIALAITGFGVKSAAKTAALEAHGVLALAEVTGVHETGTEVNDRPLVKVDLKISGPGFTPFQAQDQVIASVTRMPMITSRKLVALVDPSTSKFQIDWNRSALVSGMMPAMFTVDSDNRTYDLTGQTGPLMEILGILKAHNIGLDGTIDLRSNPAARQHVQAVVRRAGTVRAASSEVAAQSTAQRLQELDTLRATGVVTESEYAAKRQQIIAEL